MRSTPGSSTGSPVGPPRAARPVGLALAAAVLVAPLAGALAGCEAGEPAASDAAASDRAASDGAASDLAGFDPAAMNRAASGPDGRQARAVAVLRAWDRARARAFADGDVTALRRLYVPGSTAGTTDVALLRAYQQRGLRVEGLRMQLLEIEVLRRGAARLRVRVTDRVARAVAVGESGRTRLPRDRASTRVVDLRRRDGGWRVAAVSVA